MTQDTLIQLIRDSSIRIPKNVFNYKPSLITAERYEAYKEEIIEILQDERTTADIEMLNDLPKVIQIHDYHTNPEVIHTNFTLFSQNIDKVSLSIKVDLHFNCPTHVLSIFIERPLIIDNIVDDVPHMLNNYSFLNVLKHYQKNLIIPENVQDAVKNYDLL